MFVLIRSLISLLALFGSTIAYLQSYISRLLAKTGKLLPLIGLAGTSKHFPMLSTWWEIASSGIVIVHNGRIMAERYWDGPEDARYRRSLNGLDEQQARLKMASAQKVLWRFWQAWLRSGLPAG